MKYIILIASVLLLSACSGVLKKEQPICSGTAMIGGLNTTINIYGVRKEAGQTQYKAGYPFNWRWVDKTNFSSTTCS